MATITALSETSICNMALGRLGANRISSIDDTSEDSTEAIQCRLHYSQTRDALIRSHWWRFARARAILSAATDNDAFDEYTYAYDLPSDFLRMKRPYEEDRSNIIKYTYSMEGKQLLSDESPMEIRYIKRVTDPTQYDPLFVEVFILELALKMLHPLVGAGKEAMILRRDLYQELAILMRKVRAIDKQETNTVGRSDKGTWIESRLIGSGNPLKRYS